MPIDQAPDKPRAFGYKINWFAVRTRDPQSVADALKLEQVTRANWASGLAAVYDSRSDAPQWVFVSLAIGDWVLAVAPLMDLPSQIDESADDPIIAGFGREFQCHFSRLTSRFSGSFAAIASSATLLGRAYARVNRRALLLSWMTCS